MSAILTITAGILLAVFFHRCLGDSSLVRHLLLWWVIIPILLIMVIVIASKLN